jgi:hypothetical protein
MDIEQNVCGSLIKSIVGMKDMIIVRHVMEVIIWGLGASIAETQSPQTTEDFYGHIKLNQTCPSINPLKANGNSCPS